MEAALNIDFLTPEEYLEGEKASEVRHEYIGGRVYAMPGASKMHNRIVQALGYLLSSHLGSGPCAIYTNEVKVRLQVSDVDVFYYPDISVSCDPRDKDPFVVTAPMILVEVLSPSTENTDRREKLIHYIQMESLQEYVLISQSKTEVTVFRRTNQWRPEILTSPTEILRLDSIKFQAALGAVYKNIEIPGSEIETR